MNLEFVYTNWKGIDYSYVVEPESIEFVPESSTRVDAGHWVLNAYVVTRSGDPRPEMGDNRRRTFKLTEMRHIREVERSA